jgi:hypothetical protein
MSDEIIFGPIGLILIIVFIFIALCRPTRADINKLLRDIQNALKDTKRNKTQTTKKQTKPKPIKYTKPSWDEPSTSGYIPVGKGQQPTVALAGNRKPTQQRLLQTGPSRFTPSRESTPIRDGKF